jgi:hypothetical protein
VDGPSFKKPVFHLEYKGIDKLFHINIIHRKPGRKMTDKQPVIMINPCIEAGYPGGRAKMPATLSIRADCWLVTNPPNPGTITQS